MTRSPLPLLFGALAVPLVGRVLRRRRTRFAEDRGRDEVIALCSALAGELRSGQPPQAAVLRVDTSGLGDGGTLLRAAAGYGGDLVRALREAAQEPGAEGLRGVAACWQVAVHGGGGLADTLDRLAEALRAERDQHLDLRAQLEGPRSTIRTLAALPVAAIGWGVLCGWDPLGALLHTPLGLGCLLLGGLLECLGLAWAGRIIRDAEQGGG
ncbi:type II secretion system F family protein [Streptomyces sp. NPDC005438]|uniref:type II secretion system F family protein n=1 Tax=Streptomyces sp. NPDC005438 TaxID=3156880 RepID=UPI0033AB4A3F